MADMKRIKGRIAETIYPNGTGAITAESHQALLLEMVDDINAKKADQSELVATQENLEALTDTVNNLPQGGGNFNPSGTYPDLTAGDLAGRGESVPAEFGFRASGGKSIKDGRAYIKRIKGNSVVWNNMVDTRDRQGDGGYVYVNDYLHLVEGHKYAMIREKANDGFYCIPVINGSEIYDYSLRNGELAKIFTSAYTTTPSTTRMYCEQNVGKTILCDLTKMFDEGYEPSTIEEFNARVATLGVDLYADNEGQVIHCNTESIKSIGDNAWDEEWEEGALDHSNGKESISSTRIRSKNFCRIIGGEEYYLVGNNYNIVLYDENYQWLDSWGAIGEPRKVSIDSRARWFKVSFDANYGTTYKNDALISLYHSGWKAQKDDLYQPYWEDTLPLPIIRKYFPDGMKKAGSAHDEIRFNKESNMWEKVEAIGIRAYQEGDADNAAYLTDGKVTCYPLTKPIVTELDEADQNFRAYYQVADFGTEQSQSDVPSAPFRADIIYQFNAVDMIREHEMEITELQKVIATMQAQLTALTNGGQ